ncbi:MAG: 2-amino-4-oxopentanoate thiolase subunit OrtA [Christensenella sp.]|nr:2-amino-4-oxopentanoate thiolase subunit OrtA [Christensenella sp.]
MESAKKNDYVQIKFVVLDVEERKPGLPEDTAKLPYMALIQGFLEDDCAQIGEKVTITTVIGRHIQGELYAINPSYGYDFGAPIPELMEVGPELHAILDRYDAEVDR